MRNFTQHRIGFMPCRKGLWLFLAVAVFLFWSSAAQALRSAPPHPKMPRNQKHEIRQQIDQMEESWRQAVLKPDPAVLETLLSEDYISISASGTLLNREQTLENLKSGRMRFISLEFSDRKVRLYGNTALVISRAALHGVNSEGEFSGNFRFTRIYVRNDHGLWKVVSFEASRMREEGEKHGSRSEPSDGNPQ